MTQKDASASRYRTIVADPPWRYASSLPGFPGQRERRSAVPYATMSEAEIAALPVRELADARGAHLYLWTTNTHLRPAYRIAEAWGFTPSTLLVWCKQPRGTGGLPATFVTVTEFVLFCRRGSVRALTQIERNWFEWPRGPHSAKPEAFLDLVERVSPAPRLELFARRNRLGWDTWGNEALEHVELDA